MEERETNFDVTVEKLIYGGDGLSRRGCETVFTPYVLPGEQVTVRPERQQRGIAWTSPERILQAAPERVEAPCPYFTHCGGCHYQHATYEYQLQAKRGILAEEFRRIGKFEPPAEIGIVSGEPWNYRNRTLFHVRGSRIGLHEARSHKLRDIDCCPISSPAINSTLAALREMARDSRRWPGFLTDIQIFTNETEVQLDVRGDRPVAKRFFDWCGERIPGLVEGALDYVVDGVSYQVSGGSFFQVNRFLAGKLVDTALEGAAGEQALDLFAGVGLFSIPLARRFRQVTAVETGMPPVRDLQRNAERAGAAVTAVRAQASVYLEQIDKAPDLVLLDPPRQGLGKEVVRRLGELKPPRVVIVSCDPATLARDLAGLLAGGYRLDKLTLVDLFPQTFHLETIAFTSR